MVSAPGAWRNWLSSSPAAQIDELVAALELIADEHGRANKTLQILQSEAKKQVVAGAKSLESP
jgi:SLT domain-containing protein